MRGMYYRLEGRRIVPTNREGFAEVYDGDRHVGKTQIGEYWISTVFLGLDHGFSEGPPVLFETMVFDADGSTDDQQRYCTYDEAEAGHAKWVARYEARVVESATLVSGWVTERK